MKSLQLSTEKIRELTDRIQWLRSELKVASEQFVKERDRFLTECSQVTASTSLLTPRENQVFELLVKQLGNKEIAAVLNISERTVKFHVSTLLKKYGVSTRNQLILSLYQTPIPEVHKER